MLLVKVPLVTVVFTPVEERPAPSAVPFASGKGQSIEYHICPRHRHHVVAVIIAGGVVGRLVSRGRWPGNVIAQQVAGEDGRCACAGGGRRVEVVGFIAHKSPIDPHPLRDGEGDRLVCRIRFVSAGGYPDLVARQQRASKGCLQGHDVRPCAGTDRRAGLCYPKDVRDTHGDGLHHPGGFCISLIAVLRSGDGRRARTDQGQDSVS